MVQITERNACGFTVIMLPSLTFLAIQLHLLRTQAWPRGIEILARGEFILPGPRGFQHIPRSKGLIPIMTLHVYTSILKKMKINPGFYQGHALALIRGLEPPAKATSLGIIQALLISCVYGC